MRTLFCAIGLVVSVGTGTRADDKADAEKAWSKLLALYKAGLA